MNRLIKKRHYVSYITEDNDTFVENIIKMLINEVFHIHELLTSIMSDRDSQFVVTIWKSFCKRLDIQIKLFTTFHFKTNKQTKRSNQNLKRHLRIYCNHI